MSSGLKGRIRLLERRTGGMLTAKDLEEFDAWLARLIDGPSPQSQQSSVGAPFGPTSLSLDVGSQTERTS